jgi:hypothetical protein
MFQIDFLIFKGAKILSYHYCLATSRARREATYKRALFFYLWWLFCVRLVAICDFCWFLLWLGVGWVIVILQLWW